MSMGKTRSYQTKNEKGNRANDFLKNHPVGIF